MTTTPEQIEAVARAICSAKGDNWEARNFNETADGTEPEENREAYRHIARAAIDAMRPFIRAEALEEAAAHFDEMWGGMTPDDVAAAIRELKEKP